tara:strand:- start:338 stop:544 length:207 start_codon:yes stop_codon:yes gene_type:complete
MGGSGVHYKFKEFTLDTLKTIITDKTIIVGGGSIGMSFIEAIPEIIRVMTLFAYFLYLMLQIYKLWKK